MLLTTNPSLSDKFARTGLMDRFDQPEILDDLLDGWVATAHKGELSWGRFGGFDSPAQPEAAARCPLPVAGPPPPTPPKPNLGTNAPQRP